MKRLPCPDNLCSLTKTLKVSDSFDLYSEVSHVMPCYRIGLSNFQRGFRPAVRLLVALWMNPPAAILCAEFGGRSILRQKGFSFFLASLWSDALGVTAVYDKVDAPLR